MEAQPGMQMLSDTLITTPIYQGADASGMGGGAGMGDFGGVGGAGGGGAADPELEMVLSPNFSSLIGSRIGH